jgi:hypothetical protein
MDQMQARYEILRSCMAELQRAGIISAESHMPPNYQDLHPSCLEASWDANDLGSADDCRQDQRAGRKLVHVSGACEVRCDSPRSISKIHVIVEACYCKGVFSPTCHPMLSSGFVDGAGDERESSTEAPLPGSYRFGRGWRQWRDGPGTRGNLSGSDACCRQP